MGYGKGSKKTRYYRENDRVQNEKVCDQEMEDE